MVEVKQGEISCYMLQRKVTFLAQWGPQVVVSVCQAGPEEGRVALLRGLLRLKPTHLLIRSLYLFSLPGNFCFTFHIVFLQMLKAF